jgi:ABC-type phosphate transport system substrate-binding protein
MNGNDYRSFWFAEQIRGGSTAPATKKSTEAMMEYVKESPNAIGYVPKGTATDGVKVLKVK